MTSYEYLYQLGCFTRDDILKLAGNAKNADSILYNLKKKNLIASVKRNLYIVISRETGLATANPYEIASKITDSSYISHHSAFEYYGMANQVFTEINVSSSIRFNTFEFDDKTYKYIASKCDFGTVTAGKIKVTDTERTMLDSIKDFAKIGGLEELLRCLAMISFIDEAKLLSYLEMYNNQFLYQKTGYILSHYQKQMKISDSFFEKCRMNIQKSVRYLYDGIGSENPVFFSDWQIFAPADLMILIDEGDDTVVRRRPRVS